MKLRRIGSLEVSALGLGCMGMSQGYGPVDAERAAATVVAALDNGITFFDTADVYGNGDNERLLASILGRRIANVVVATKCGLIREPDGLRVDGRPSHIRKACDGSLVRLGLETIDLYYLHRPDTAVPIEESVGALEELRRAGKVRELGLSEASADTLTRACRVASITALQSQWSLFERRIEGEVLRVCREHAVSVVPFAPLGRGMLSGDVRGTEGLDDADLRRRLPQFRGGALEQNIGTVERLADVARSLEVTPAQVALAWLLSRGTDVVPIPGTTRPEHVAANAAATELELSTGDLRTLAPLIGAGDPYDEMGWAARDTPHPPMV